ncbi:MAG: right-handed parallel beta-helix repeat-containing protein, partial [Promethearchaeota archaeon]
LLVGLVLSYLNPQDDSESVLNTLSSNPALSEKPFTTKAPIDPDILAGRTFSPHVPIEIAKNTDFNETNGVTAGDGSAGDPFIIEGWNITSPNVSCISIHDTTAYFIIQNCLLNSSAYHSANGIYIGYVSSGTANITNNICTNTDVAITISNSPDADVTSNYCQDNTYALVVEYSNTVNISHNHFTDHTWGVEISDTNSLIFYNNTVNVSFYNGVEIYACNSPLLENNTISRSG